MPLAGKDQPATFIYWPPLDLADPSPPSQRQQTSLRLLHCALNEPLGKRGLGTLNAETKGRASMKGFPRCRRAITRPLAGSSTDSRGFFLPSVPFDPRKVDFWDGRACMAMLAVRCGQGLDTTWFLLLVVLSYQEREEAAMAAFTLHSCFLGSEGAGYWEGRTVILAPVEG